MIMTEENTIAASFYAEINGKYNTKTHIDLFNKYAHLWNKILDI